MAMLRVEQALAACSVVAAIVVAATVPHQAMHLYEKNARSAAAENAYWTVTGPPCIPMSKEAFASQPFHPDLHGFNFQEVRVSYAFGAAECREYGDRRSNYRRCMFTSPAVIRVNLDGAETVYIPGIGHPATITVTGGKLSCVLASNYTAISPSFGQDEATFEETHPTDSGQAEHTLTGLAG